MGYPTPTKMRPNLLYFAKANALIGFHFDTFQDYDFRSNLNNRRFDSFSHE